MPSCGALSCRPALRRSISPIRPLLVATRRCSFTASLFCSREWVCSSSAGFHGMAEQVTWTRCRVKDAIAAGWRGHIIFAAIVAALCSIESWALGPLSWIYGYGSGLETIPAYLALTADDRNFSLWAP